MENILTVLNQSSKGREMLADSDGIVAEPKTCSDLLTK
jgi:hypothetical protein